MRALTLLLLLAACSPKPEDTAAPGDSGDTGDTGEDTADDSGEDSGDSADTGQDTGGDDTGPDTGDDPDSGGDSGGDTGADTGTDTGEDTADDTAVVDTGDPDTGDTGASACTVADLAWGIEIRDSAGTAGTTFTAGDDLTFYGIVRNPCTSDVTFNTSSACLVTTAEVVDASGVAMGVGMACASVVTAWTVPAGGAVEEGLNVGRLAPGSYGATIYFDVRGASATTALTVTR